MDLGEVGSGETEDEGILAMGYMEAKERYSEIITLLRFPLILMLVFTHFDISSAGIIQSYGGVYDVKLPLLVDIIVFSFGHLFGGVWVACFYLMSGYLFFLNYEPTTDCYMNKLKRRITSLLIPYMIWNVIWSVYETGSAYVRYKVTGVFVFFQDDAVTSVWRLLYEIFWERPSCGSFWFIRDLMVFAFLSPILYRLLRCRMSFSVIMILWILPFFHSFTIVEGGLGALVFFMMGGGSFVETHKCFEVDEIENCTCFILRSGNL